MATSDAPMNQQRWCICRLCIDGFAIPVDYCNGEEYRVCGEICAVGLPKKKSTAVDGTQNKSVPAAILTTLDSPLHCNICGEEIEVDMSLSKPCVSDDDHSLSSFGN